MPDLWEQSKQRVGRVGGTKTEAEFRGHKLTAWVRKPTMDEEAAILAAGLDPKTRRIKSHSAILQEFIRRCVTKTDFNLTAAKLDDPKIQRDTDLLWFLYKWLGVEDLTNDEVRSDYLEAVQKKPSGSSTAKPRTPRPKPASSGAPSAAEE